MYSLTKFSQKEFSAHNVLDIDRLRIFFSEMFGETYIYLFLQFSRKYPPNPLVLYFPSFFNYGVFFNFVFFFFWACPDTLMTLT